LLDAELQFLSALDASAATTPPAPKHPQRLQAAPPLGRHRVHAVLWTLGLIALATGLRYLLNPLLNDRVPFATYFIGIVLALRYVGSLSAITVMLGGLAMAILLWFPKGVGSAETITAIVVYLVSGSAILFLGRQMYQAEALAEARLGELQQGVQGLRASQGRLQLATEISELGVFEWDIANDRFTGENPDAYRIFGRTPDMPKLTMADFVARHLHPDDAHRVQLALQAAMRPGERFNVVFRNRRGEIDWRWVEIAGRFFFDDLGRPLHLIGVIADISERKDMEDALRKLAGDLAEADARKDEFLATLAHELRNPLAPIRNGIELLKRAPGDPAQVDRVTGVMDRQMSHLVRLVDDLIDVSRITRNKLELRREWVQLAQVVQAAVEASRPLVESRGHHLEVRLPSAPVPLDADLTRLVQVFANLLNNAAKYTDRGGAIRLSAERRGGEVEVVVEDNGSGIPRDQQHRLFEMFTQLDRSLERAQGGLGIGLAMVRRLVELHGGTVAIESEGAGRGTRAIVRLPVVLTPGAPASIDGPGGAVPAQRRILVVDDNTDAADSLANVLRLMGHEVAVGADGVEAVALAESFAPDVLMLDIGMPRMNGYEACQRIRALDAGRAMVIVAVTGWGQDEDRRRSEAAGFDYHLTKPVDPRAVESLLISL
jgi:PAS domain S-box-containing protein